MSSKLAVGGQVTNVAQSFWELMGKANLSAESFGVGNSTRHTQLPSRHARVCIPGPSPEGPQGKDNGGQGLLGVPPGLGSGDGGQLAGTGMVLAPLLPTPGWREPTAPTP